jgi:hypothetical protein
MICKARSHFANKNGGRTREAQNKPIAVYFISERIGQADERQIQHTPTSLQIFTLLRSVAIVPSYMCLAPFVVCK